jgi:hypothetical protein
MRVIWSIGPPEQDGEFWLHVSVSRDNDLPITVRPSYQDLATVKAVFVGQERYAYSVWPPTDKHVNIHTGVLHLWSPVTGHERGQALPEFSRGLGTI